MLERILFAANLIALGTLAYGILLLAQRRRVQKNSRRAPPSARPALLVFTSPTCAPCKLQQLPVVDQLMEKWGAQIELRVIDVTEQPDVASQFGIWSLPTTVVLSRQRQVIAINQGVAGARQLGAQIEESLYRRSQT